MQFIPFKGVKRLSFNVTSFGQSTLYTTTADSLVFVNVYMSLNTILYNKDGQVWWVTSVTDSANQDRVNLWVGREATTANDLIRIGAGAGGSFVPAGEAILQDDIYLGVGTVKIDLYILELNDQIVPST